MISVNFAACVAFFVTLVLGPKRAVSIIIYLRKVQFGKRSGVNTHFGALLRIM